MAPRHAKAQLGLYMVMPKPIRAWHDVARPAMATNVKPFMVLCAEMTTQNELRERVKWIQVL